MRKAFSACLSGGRDIWELACGIDPRPVVPDREAASIGAEDTLAEDLAGRDALLPHVHSQVHCSDLCTDLGSARWIAGWNVLLRGMLNIARMGLLPAFLLGSLASVGCHRLCSVISSSAPKTENEKVFYALGMDIGKSVDVFSLSPSELEMVKAGLTDAVTKRPSKIDFDKTRPKIREMVQQRKQVRIDAEKEKGKNFLAKAAKESGATVLPSGVVFRTVRSGTGASPVATDTVKVNYEGHLIDGTVFDSSYKKNQP
ncbi:MAG: FKBP-type peptidyl-prolyl cis-trans isomerase N-terminal domain-containing protein, partial [Polyangia bacterium]